MEIATEEYQGFTIAVTPMRDRGGLWDVSYQITKTGQGGQDGDPAAALTRTQSAGGYATERAACAAGMAVARTDVDKLLALARPGPSS
jgi:hypothetical protein